MADIVESTRVNRSYRESVSDELRGRRFIDVLPSFFSVTRPVILTQKYDDRR
jgi:hypothetical protein